MPVTTNEYGLMITAVEPREELVPEAPPVSVYVPFDVGERIGVAVETLSAMFPGSDKPRLADKLGPSFKTLYDALQVDHNELDAEVETFPGLWVVDEDGLTFSAVVRGHDRLSGKDGQ